MTADMAESRGHICDKGGEAGTARDAVSVDVYGDQSEENNMVRDKLMS